MSLEGQYNGTLSYQKSNYLNVLDNQYKNPGTIRVWGDIYSGGNTGQVIGINGVKSIYSTDKAFAALKEDGTVEVWGNTTYGGNTGQVAELSNVNRIYSTIAAFAALKNVL